MHADWTAGRRWTSVPVPPRMRPATHPRRDRNRRRDGSGSPAPCPPRREISFRPQPGSCGTLPSIIDHDRPHLDRTGLGAGNACGDPERGVEILGLDQVIAAKLLARLSERTVRRQYLAVAD